MGKLTHINLHREIDLDKLFQQETYSDYVRNDSNYFRYKRGVSIARKFANSGKWEIDIDDPEEKLSNHQIHVKMIEDDYSGEEYREYVDMLNQFDNMMFFGDRNGDTSFVIGVNDVYVDPNETKE